MEDILTDIVQERGIAKIIIKYKKDFEKYEKNKYKKFMRRILNGNRREEFSLEIVKFMRRHNIYYINNSSSPYITLETNILYLIEKHLYLSKNIIDKIYKQSYCEYCNGIKNDGLYDNWFNKLPGNPNENRIHLIISDINLDNLCFRCNLYNCKYMRDSIDTKLN